MILNIENSIYTSIKNKIYSLLYYSDYDLPQIIKFLEKYSSINNKPRVLDVGSGAGRKLKAIQEAGYDVLGVEINTELVKANINNGLKCLTLDEFSATSEQFDTIIMSHIIEHFNHLELKNFLDSYLDRLKMGGHLIIATPLISSYFYDDFDHVKPYSPQGIMMVFGENYDKQVQYYSKNKIELKDLWFRRRHYRPQFFKGRYMKTSSTKILQIIEVLSILLCKLSFGFIGKTDGWIGVFKKVK